MEQDFTRHHTPYCGVAPVPVEILTRWNIDPVLLSCLGVIVALYLAMGARANGPVLVARWRTTAFVAGWSVGVLALITPLCPLSVALFSARVGEHMILACVSAPLIALGRPGERLARLMHIARARRDASVGRARPLHAAIAFTAALWFWHAPAPYKATFESTRVYWAMQITLYASALWFWSALFDRSGHELADFVAATFLTTGQMGLLGAVITFAARPLYAPHWATTAAWGLTPMQDQQLGGVVMWVPAGFIFALALVFAFVGVMRRADGQATLSPVLTRPT